MESMFNNGKGHMIQRTDIFRSTSKSRPNNIRGGKNVRPYVRPSVHKKFL